MKEHLNFVCILTVLYFLQTVSPTEFNWCTFGCECPTEGTYAYLLCSHKNITELPLGIQFRNDTSGILLKGNNIQNITTNTFKISPFLEELDLSDNGLTTVEDNSFWTLSGLKYLHLSNNKLEPLSSTLLKGLSNLQKLELGHNMLKNLPKDFFIYTPHLTELKLQYNALKSLNEHSFLYLTYLEKLDLQNNGLESLDDHLFQYVPNLRWLSLSDNHFDVVPKEVFRRTILLRNLDLGGNNFNVLESGSFSALKSLSSLYLDNLHWLKRIEKNAFSNMTELKLLSCSYNRNLNFVDPEAFGTYRTLYGEKRTYPTDKLIMSHNGLTSLPEPPRIETWITTDSVDWNNNPWICDCKLRWMTRLKMEVAESIRCASPFIHHGRSIASIDEDELICDDHWAFSRILLVLTSMMAFTICLVFVMAFACYKTPLGQYVKAKGQFSYIQVPPRKECVDLEWDHTAEM